MKKYFLTLLCAALAGTAWAQAPAQTGLLPGGVQEIPSSVHVGSLQLVSGGLFGGGDCCKSYCKQPRCCQTTCPTKCCQPATKTICVPELAVKVTVKFTYSSVCEKVCYPKCTLGGFLGGHGCNKGCDTGCGTGNCNQAECASHIYQKKYLIKHKCVTECPTTKCVPVCVPACDTHRGVVMQRSGAPAVEAIPVAPNKK